MVKKISMLNSKTCGTELNAFLLRLRQIYCFVACRKGVSPFVDADGIVMLGSAKRSECDRRTDKTRCSDNNLDRRSCARGSFSLWIIQVQISSSLEWFVATNRLPLTQKRLHVEFAKSTEDQKRILDEQLCRRQMPDRAVRLLWIRRIQRLRLHEMTVCLSRGSYRQRVRWQLFERLNVLVVQVDPVIRVWSRK